MSQKFYIKALIAFVITMLVCVDGNGLGDLGANPQWERLNRIIKHGDFNRYSLYTSLDRNSGQRLQIDNGASVRASDFDPQVPTAILIHGWQSQPIGPSSSATKALLNKGDVNVIVVDWRAISSLDYVTAVVGVPSVGNNVGQLLEYLHSATGAPYSSMHLIGHSLGSHVAANAGRYLGGQVARITGLDPAGPMWEVNPKRLKPSDAVYVEAIHTNTGLYGLNDNVGDVDFYPNGGFTQPGCLTPLCDHFRAIDLFGASVADPNHLVGNQCANLLQMRLDSCKGAGLPLGNDDLRKTGSGVYRLNTGRRYPF